MRRVPANPGRPLSSGDDAVRGTWRIRTDGAARGNPGPAGIGVVLESPDGKAVAELARGIGWATNNVAEYTALLAGLELALHHGARRVVVASDSTLLVQQMRGAYRVKHPGLRPLHERARELAAKFDHVAYEAVPRETNRRADRLANEAIDRDNPDAPPPDPGQRALF